MLLRFRTANHRSLRDPAELSLVSSKARGAVPTEGDWGSATTRVAGIYGANASGKSNVLDAIDLMRAAIQHSATQWGDRKKFPFVPFAFDEECRRRSSSFEVDFTIGRIRYTYGFESNSAGIQAEWLHSYPLGRRRVLFERTMDGGASSITFGRHLPGENSTISKLVRPNALFLSVAANNNHHLLKEISDYLIDSITYAKYNNSDQQNRLRWVREALEDPVLFTQAEALLRFADLGISRLKLDVKEPNAEQMQLVEGLVKSLRENLKIEDEDAVAHGVLEDIRKRIQFVHQYDTSGNPSSLTIKDESSGTVAWLSLGVPALDAVRNGGVFIIDEIDSSLHPRLTAALVRVFKDPGINKTGAQLIFTSHETTLLSNLLGDVLDPEEIWLTEKKRDGSTELYSLVEFSIRDSDNIQRRYLQGRYGATPMIELDELRLAVTDAGR